MMADATQVEFRIVPGSQPPARFACTLVDELRRAGRRVHIHAGTASDAAALDNLLWTFRDISFLPHCLQDDAEAAGSPVTIGTQTHADAADRVLINLADEVPDFATAFARIIELVPDDAADKDKARARFRRYRTLGLAPQMQEPGDGR
jgi:DNA polymerase-3 subunit chi